MTTLEFGELFLSIRNGLNVKQDKSGEGLPITRIETISTSTVNPLRVGFADLTKEKHGGWLLRPGDILFSHINSPLHVGRCAIYTGNPAKLIHGMNLLCLRPDPKTVTSEYAAHLIRSPLFRSLLAPFVNKAVNQASVSIGNLKTIQVPLPSKAEQRRIAAMLDQADALRAKRRVALAHLDDLTQSIFLDMFGGQENERPDWPVEPFEALVATTSGGTPSRADQGNFGGSIPWVKSGELHSGTVMSSEESITEKALANSSAKLMPPGTVLLAMYGATAGAVAILGIEAATNQAICCIQLGPKVDRTYLVHRLKRMTPALLAQRAGGAQPNLSQGIVRALRIPVPPLALQKKFSDRVSQIEKLRTVQSSQLIQLANLFSSAQSRAFAGEL